MDFFASQDEARRKTRWLVVYFILASAVLVLAVYAAALATLGLAHSKMQESGIDSGVPLGSWWHPEVFLISTTVTLSVIALGTLYKTWELRRGGQFVAVMLGGRPVAPTTSNLGEKRLMNVVEEMALASGIPVPAVYVLDREPAINAFAAGFQTGDAVVAVTRGALDQLTRDELQGVVAHEFSHILNGDMRLNLRMIGLLYGIQLIAIIGYYILRGAGGSSRSRSSRKGGGGQILLFGLALLVIGFLGVALGRLIKAAICRQREYLADASAVQFTRNPDGIGGALKKIGGQTLLGKLLRSAEAETASHMFFSNVLRNSVNLWATHPPLPDRIHRVLPDWDGKFPVVKPVMPGAPIETAKAAEKKKRQVVPPITPRQLMVNPVLILAAVGTPQSRHVQFVRNMLKGIPPALRTALNNPYQARLVVLAMLLAEDRAVLRRQWEMVERHLGKPACDNLKSLAPLVAEQPPEHHLPLIELVHNPLRELSPEQYETFRKTVVELARADQKISFFEFVLLRTLIVRLDRSYSKPAPITVRYRALKAVEREIQVLISALAYVGQRQEDEQKRAFDQAVATFDPESPICLLPRNQCSLQDVGHALDKLVQCSPAVKRRILQAAVAAVAADQKVTVQEAELLRAVADSLDCPLPPIFAGDVK